MSFAYLVYSSSWVKLHYPTEFACALLVICQQRIDTFHEISLIHRRLLKHDRTLWELRSEIAHRCRPSQVRLVVHQLGDNWQPIPAIPHWEETGSQPAIELASQSGDLANWRFGD